MPVASARPLHKDLVRPLLTTVVDFEWLWLLALLPVVIVIRPNLTPLLLLLPLLWSLRKLVYGRFVTATPLDLALLLLLAMLLVSLYATFDLAFSLDKVAGLLVGIALYYAVTAMAARSLRWLATAVALYMALGAGVALLCFLGARWSNKLPLVAGLISQLPARLVTVPGGPDSFNPNQVAGVLLWVVPLALLLTGFGLLNARQIVARWSWPRGGAVLLLMSSVTLLMTAVLVLTQSRSALVGLVVSVALMFILVSWRRSPRWLAVVVVLALLLVAGFWLRPPDWLPPGLTGGSVALLDESAVLRSLDGRIEIWSRALYGLQDFPFTGMGMGTFRHVVHILYPLFLISPTVDIAHAHNHLLQTGLDLGLPGLVAYLAIWLGAMVMLWQATRLAQEAWRPILAMGLAGSLVAYFVYGLTDAVALGAKPGFIFWYLLGLVAALHRLRQSERVNSKQLSVISEQ